MTRAVSDAFWAGTVWGPEVAVVAATGQTAA